uniref:ATM interactor n=1 Tax=Latimeria chalumnae TaxID=7897 RepID=H3AHT5_LATCH
MAACVPGRASSDQSHTSGRTGKNSLASTAQPWEIIKPSVKELTKEVRTNILCTVEGCGKILPNTPALNMHLVKSHRVQDGIINPTVRKDLKSSQKLYCCPIEGCPRGPNRPFSQFSLVKQHFMKMHAERKHKCSKCSNSYGTEWDLKRHTEDCGKTFQCTCGCPYASRTALLSHIYRTGHEIPAEHRDPPGKKRKMDVATQNQQQMGKATKLTYNKQPTNVDNAEHKSPRISTISPVENLSSSNVNSTANKTSMSKQSQKLLLPKPKVTLVKLPVMQFSHLPFIVSSSDSSVKQILVAVNNPGSVLSTMHLLPPPMGTVLPAVDTKFVTLSDTMPVSKTTNFLSLEPVGTGVQVNLVTSSNSVLPGLEDMCQRNSSNSMNIQTDLSYSSQNSLSTLCASPESSVSSCSQTDISFSAEVSLPVSVETQTFASGSKSTTSVGAQTENCSHKCFPLCGISEATQTVGNVSTSYDASTQTSFTENTLVAGNLDQSLMQSNDSNVFSEARLMKLASVINFNTQNSLLPQQTMTDNQTQTMNLFSDLESMFSEAIPSHSLGTRGLLSDASTSCEADLASSQAQNAGIDFYIEEFLSATNIQTQTEESELGTINSEPVLESLDIETQTDFLFLDTHTQPYNGRGNSNYLGLEMFDTQTQTDLDFLLDNSTPLPLGSILKQSSFSMSTESSDTETQTEVHILTKNNPTPADSHIQLNSAETQTISSCFEGLGNLFLTSNETQTAMDDFLLADLAWNTMESQFSSVETQTCDELFLSSIC